MPGRGQLPAEALGRAETTRTAWFFGSLPDRQRQLFAGALLRSPAGRRSERTAVPEGQARSSRASRRRLAPAGDSSIECLPPPPPRPSCDVQPALAWPDDRLSNSGPGGGPYSGRIMPLLLSHSIFIFSPQCLLLQLRNMFVTLVYRHDWNTHAHSIDYNFLRERVRTDTV